MMAASTSGRPGFHRSRITATTAPLHGYPEWLQGASLTDGSSSEEDNISQPVAQSPAPCVPDPVTQPMRPSQFPPASGFGGYRSTASEDANPWFSPWRVYPAPRLTKQGLRTLKRLSRNVRAACKRPARAAAPLTLDVSKLSSPLRRLVDIPEETYSIYTRTRSRTGGVRTKTKRS